jgi:hypothetical protein
MPIEQQLGAWMLLIVWCLVMVLWRSDTELKRNVHQRIREWRQDDTEPLINRKQREWL